ncbi:hypothetical protein ABT112_11085 [Streptomyces sp. NPDC002055]|uniref:hypothetical protein n=1 Tax=Streptomyces sp. NPDC002055 TaxID=3154534 RepID=UPI00331B1080
MTRTTGWLTLLCAYGAIVMGLAPWLFLPPKAELLAPLCAAVLFACCWVFSSWTAERRRAAERRYEKSRGADMLRSVEKTWSTGGAGRNGRAGSTDKPRRAVAARRTRQRRPSRVLRWVIGFAIALSSGAALCQGVGPDGEQAAWRAEVLKSGGGSYRVPIDRVTGTPVGTGVSINDVKQYAARVVVTLDFPHGSRAVTVEGARTAGPPKAGKPVHVLYAPGRPALGVRDSREGFFDGRVFAFFIWAGAVVAGCFTVGCMEPGDAAWLRQFRPGVHLPAFGILICGAALLLPLALGFPTTAEGWLLAVGAASTPWLAVAWVKKAS